jgi:very-short-patch-repair endonuclease
MSFALNNKAFIIKEYYDNKRSADEISKDLGTYPNKVRRALKSYGGQIRSKSEAQKLALESGRHPHPTKGKTHSEETKVKISDKVYDYWKGMDDDERDRRSQLSKDQWESMSVAERSFLQDSAAKAVRKSAKEGSKMEKFLSEYLTKEGFPVIFHKKGFSTNAQIEVDLLLPESMIAIEIDGPAHFFPIWGQESLNRHIKADAEKSALLLQEGLCIIRVKQLTKELSKKNMRDAAGTILKLVQSIVAKFPAKTNRYIEIDIS